MHGGMRYGNFTSEVSGTHLYFCHAILKHIPKRKTNYGGVTSRVYDEPSKKLPTIRGTAIVS